LSSSAPFASGSASRNLDFRSETEDAAGSICRDIREGYYLLTRRVLELRPLLAGFTTAKSTNSLMKESSAVTGPWNRWRPPAFYADEPPALWEGCAAV
jgi:hypothetical protein